MQRESRLGLQEFQGSTDIEIVLQLVLFGGRQLPRMSSLRQLPNPFRIGFGYPQPEPFTRGLGGQVAHTGLDGSVPDFSFCNCGIGIHIQNDTRPPEQAQLRKSGEFLPKSGQSKPAVPQASAVGAMVRRQLKMTALVVSDMDGQPCPDTREGKDCGCCQENERDNCPESRGHGGETCTDGSPLFSLVPGSPLF
jgi:hypothetical protein